jgi:hypothetical protein
MESINFKENHTFTNFKMLFGTLSLAFTGLAYLYPKPFPENYYVVLLSVIGYHIIIQILDILFTLLSIGEV